MTRTLLLLLLALAAGPSALGARALVDPAPADTTDFEPGSPSYEHLEGRGFYRRRAGGQGWFATRREPAFARSYRFAEVFRTTPGVDTVERDGRTFLVSTRAGGLCLLAIFSDGAYTTIRALDELNIEDIAAVEVYRGPAEVPFEFRAPSYDRTCGALVLWTRIDLDE